MEESAQDFEYLLIPQRITPLAISFAFYGLKASKLYVAVEREVVARLRTDAAKRFKTVTNAMAVIGKMLLVAEPAFRRVKHPELMPKVSGGITFVDGVEEKTRWPPDSFPHLLTRPPGGYVK